MMWNLPSADPQPAPRHGVGAHGSELGPAVIDEARVAEFRELEADGDLGLLADLFAAFLREAPARVRALHEAASRRDASRITLGAHALKGACLDIGALEMALLAFKLERRGRAGDLSEAAHLLIALDEALERVRDAIEDIEGN